jgi:hypothetical protein
MSGPGESSIEPSVSSSYGMNMITLTGMSGSGSKIEIPLSGKSGQGEQAGSAGAVVMVHGVIGTDFGDSRSSGADAGCNENSRKNVFD